MNFDVKIVLPKVYIIIAIRLTLTVTLFSNVCQVGVFFFLFVGDSGLCCCCVPFIRVDACVNWSSAITSLRVSIGKSYERWAKLMFKPLEMAAVTEKLEGTGQPCMKSTSRVNHVTGPPHPQRSLAPFNAHSRLPDPPPCLVKSV